jgi:hypothetical protein
MPRGLRGSALAVVTDRSKRDELGRPRTVQNGAKNRNVGQLLPISRLSQEQATSTHVSAADELARKNETLAEHSGQDLDILRGSNAPKEHDLADGSDLGAESLGCLLERSPITGVAHIDVAAGEPAKHRVRHERVRSAEPGVRRDDVNAVADDGIPEIRRQCKPASIGELAPEVQPAHEREDVAEWRAIGRPQRDGQGKRGSRRKELRRSPPAAIGWRQQKDPRRHA